MKTTLGLRRAAHMAAAIFLILLFAALRPALLSAQDEAEDIEFYVEEATDSFEATDFDDVADLLQEGLEFYPDNLDLKILDAKLKAKTGEYETALVALAALTADGARPELATLRARLQFDTGAYEDCIAACEALVAADANNFDARILLGDARLCLGDREQADEAWQWFIAFYESKERLETEESLAVARACFRLRRWKDTSMLFDTVLSKDKENITALLEHAEVLMLKDNPQRANERLRIARKLKRMDPEVLTGCAAYEVSQRRGENAQDMLDRALKVNPNYTEAYCVRALLELSRENPEAAFADLTKAVEINPRHIEARALLAVAYFMNGDDDAYKEQEAAVQAFNPRCAEFYKIVGRYLQVRLLVKESIEILEKARALDPTDYDIYHELGIAYMRFGDQERGRAVLAEANENDPYSAWTYNYLELLDKMDDRFITLSTEHFRIRVDKAEVELLGPYLEYLSEQAFDTLTAKYGADLETPIIMESFSDHSDFAVRTIGMPGLGALGACWGKLCTLFSPQKPQGGQSPPMEQFSWAVTMWHEFTHIVHLQMSGNRIPRWLAEGNASYEQDKKYPSWDRDFDMQLVTAWHKKALPEIRTFNSWFYDGRVLFAYYLGGVYNEYIADDYGFDKLVGVIRGCREGKTILELIQEVLGVTPEEYDRRFYAYVGRVVEPWKFAPVWSMKTIEEMRLQAEQHPDDATLQARLADAFSEVGIQVDADIAMHKAMELDPDSREVDFARARIAMRKGDSETAIPLYEKAFSKGLDYFQIRYQLGKHYLTQGKKEENQELMDMGLEHLETALERFPAFSGEQGAEQCNDACELLIKYYEETKNPEKQMYWIEKFVSVVQTATGKLSQLADYYASAGNDEKAIEFYWQIALVNPWRRETHEPCGRLMLKAGDFQRAMLEYNAACYFDPGNYDLQVELARCWLGLNERAKALELVQRVLRKDENHAGAQALLLELQD